MNYKKRSMVILVISCGIVALLVLTLASNPKYLLVPETNEIHYVEGEDAVKEEEDAKREAFAESKIEEWAKAFCNRDGDTILTMSTPEAIYSLLKFFLLPVYS